MTVMKRPEAPLFSPSARPLSVKSSEEKQKQNVDRWHSAPL